jgi:hypothetical protein
MLPPNLHGQNDKLDRRLSFPGKAFSIANGFPGGDAENISNLKVSPRMGCHESYLRPLPALFTDLG